ncbi:MAG TPA: ABC transporter ATP-binding protein [Actinomycetota bacterium]|jgi:ABC-type multidrug transport system fused ATPase/permease subunit|nr:ABC transporter ATP-binding protein [Actinomycetota bacterium]
MRTDEPELEAPQRVARDVFGRGIRLILSYVRMHPKPFALAVAGALLFAVGSVAVTIALGRVTDRVLRPAFTPEGVSASTIWLGVAAVVGLACIRAAGIGIRRYFSGVMGSSVAASLRDRVSDRYRDLSLSYHRGRPTGELLAHMEADVEASIEVIYPVPFSVGVILLVVFALISLVVTDPFLTLVGLVVIPTLGLMNRAFARRMQAPVERAQERIGEVSAIAHESIDGALVVKTLGRENAEVNRLRTKAQELRDQRVRAGYVRATFEEGLEALPNLAVIVLLAIGSWRLSTGDVTLGTLVQVVTLFGLLSWPMRFVGWILAEIPRAVVGHGRVTEVLEQPVTIDLPADPTPLPDGPLDVRAEALTYGFDGFRVLDEVAFHIEENESVAIVGATGVGKSTLAQLIVRLDDPDSGEILLGGVNVRHVEPRSLRRAASIVFQESFLFANTVAENIGLDSDATRQDIERAATIARADRFIRDLPNGYDTVLGERGHTLSGGERQRVALARALVRSPRVLILDDATSAVDPTIEAEILAALRTNLQTTLIVVAYRLSTIRLADRVLYLDDGRIRATGSHDELMAEPGYAAMIRAYERRERRAATEQGADREAARR